MGRNKSPEPSGRSASSWGSSSADDSGRGNTPSGSLLPFRLFGRSPTKHRPNQQNGVANGFAPVGRRQSRSTSRSPDGGHRRTGRRSSRHTTVEPFSPFAVALGFNQTEKWVDVTDPSVFTGFATDRTHGARGRPISDGSVRYAKAANNRRTETDSSQSMKKREGKYGPYAPIANIELVAAPAPAAERRELPDFSGRWKCTNAAGEWETYLRLCGVPNDKIKLARGARWGAGITVQEIHMPWNKETMTIVNMAAQVRARACWRTSDAPCAPPSPLLQPRSNADLLLRAAGYMVAGSGVHPTGESHAPAERREADGRGQRGARGD